MSADEIKLGMLFEQKLSWTQLTDLWDDIEQGPAVEVELISVALQKLALF